MEEVKAPNDKIDLNNSFEVLKIDLSRILKFLTIDKDLSLESIHDSTGISIQQLEKILEGRVNKLPSEIKILSLLNLIQAESVQESDPEALKKRFNRILEGPLLDYLKKRNESVQMLSEFSEHRVADLLHSPVFTLILLASSTHKGITQAKIKELLGDVGIQNLHTLHSHDFVTQVGRRYFLNKSCEAFKLINFKETLQSIMGFVQNDPNFFPKDDEKKNNIAFESLNEEGVKALLYEHSLFSEKTAAILKNPQYRGDAMVCSSSFVQEIAKH